MSLSKPIGGDALWRTNAIRSAEAIRRDLLEVERRRQASKKVSPWPPVS